MPPPLSLLICEARHQKRGTLGLETEAVEIDGFLRRVHARRVGAETRQRIHIAGNETDIACSALFRIEGRHPRYAKVVIDAVQVSKQRKIGGSGLESPEGPYKLISNSRTLLGTTDMVFLDAIGTGFSRTIDPSDNKLYWGIDEDADAFVQAIQHYIVSQHRETSPKYLFGESYGTMRAAIVGNKLEDKGTSVDGIVMLSTILNFGHFASGLDQLSVDLLPSYAAIAWYHQKVDAKGASLPDWVAQARMFAGGAYARALEQGSRISTADRDRATAEMARLTGLAPSLLQAHDLKIDASTFRHSLLADINDVIGYQDGRYRRADSAGPGKTDKGDPFSDVVNRRYAAAFEDYAKDRLHYADDGPFVLGRDAEMMKVYDWSHQPPNAERQARLPMPALILPL